MYTYTSMHTIAPVLIHRHTLRVVPFPPSYGFKITFLIIGILAVYVGFKGQIDPPINLVVRYTGTLVAVTSLILLIKAIVENKRWDSSINDNNYIEVNKDNLHDLYALHPNKDIISLVKSYLIASEHWQAYFRGELRLYDSSLSSVPPFSRYPRKKDKTEVEKEVALEAEITHLRNQLSELRAQVKDLAVKIKTLNGKDDEELRKEQLRCKDAMDLIIPRWDTVIAMREKLRNTQKIADEQHEDTENHIEILIYRQSNTTDDLFNDNKKRGLFNNMVEAQVQEIQAAFNKAREDAEKAKAAKAKAEAEKARDKALPSI